MCHGNKLSTITQLKSWDNLNLEVKFWLKGNEEKKYIKHFSGHLQNKHFDIASEWRGVTYCSYSSMLMYSPQNRAKWTLQKLVCSAYLRTYKLIIDAPTRRLNLNQTTMCINTDTSNFLLPDWRLWSKIYSGLKALLNKAGNRSKFEIKNKRLRVRLYIMQFPVP